MRLTPGKLHPSMWWHAVVVKASIPVRIAHQNRPLSESHTDTSESASSSRGDARKSTNAIRLEVGKCKGLHTAHRSSNRGVQRIDTESVQQRTLSTHHVEQGKRRESCRPAFAGFAVWPLRGWAGGAADKWLHQRLESQTSLS